jgi:hypothetical protein
MNEKKLWDIVEKINWAELSKQPSVDTQAIALKLAFEMSREEASQLYMFVYKKRAEVAKVASKLMTDLGSDSFNDLCCHVVGLGKSFFEAVLKQPEILLHLNYVESFSYCIPGEFQYELLAPGHFDKEVDKFWNEVFLPLFDLLDRLDDNGKEALEKIASVIVALQCASLSSLPEERGVLKIWKSLEASHLKANRNMFEVFAEAINRGRFWLDNLVSDARRVWSITGA